MKAEVREIVRRELDERVALLRAALSAAQRPARGWLRAIRDAVGLSQSRLAKTLHITQQSYADLESAEERGTITLRSLERAAEAMDCQLAYFLLPRGSVARTYEELSLLHDPKRKHLRASEHSMALEGQSVDDLKSK
jgi:predicted DNA-binding mobile mystery protein A